MFSMPILDIAIGLSFIYLLLGLLCTTLNEIIAGSRGTRAKFLDKGISRLLGDDSELKTRLYQHPLIQGLSSSATKVCPSYIPADKFVTALLDVLSGTGRPLTDVAAVKEGLQGHNQSVQIALGALLDQSQGDSALLQHNIESWFNDGMDRVSGWYKRNAQRNSLILAGILTLALNADTIHVGRVLWTNPAMRAAVVDEAQARDSKRPAEEAIPMVDYDDPNNATASTPHKEPEDTSSNQALTPNEQAVLGQLTGWEPDWKDYSSFGQNGRASKTSQFLLWLGSILYSHGIGWIVTALAVSLGAPFWFDMLNRFMNIRTSGRAPDEPRDKSSQPAPQAKQA